MVGQPEWEGLELLPAPLERRLCPSPGADAGSHSAESTEESLCLALSWDTRRVPLARTCPRHHTGLLSHSHMGTTLSPLKSAHRKAGAPDPAVLQGVTRGGGGAGTKLGGRVPVGDREKPPGRGRAVCDLR